MILVVSYHSLTFPSYAIQFYCCIRAAVRDTSWSCLPLPVDICRFWQRQLLLCHHIGLESGVDDIGRRLIIRCPARRVGVGATRDEGQRGPPDIEMPRKKGLPQHHQKSALSTPSKLLLRITYEFSFNVPFLSIFGCGEYLSTPYPSASYMLMAP